jgi:NADH:ubiquinone oxidoreductase subunit 3 (subunit A)
MLKRVDKFRSRYALVLIMLILLMVATLIPENPLYNLNWALLSTLLVFVAILVFLFTYLCNCMNFVPNIS